MGNEITALLSLLTNLAMIGTLVSLLVAIYYLFKRRFRDAGFCGLILLISGFCFSSFGDADARAKGFVNLADMQAANKAGYSDPVSWQPKKAGLQAEAAAADAQIQSRLTKEHAATQATAEEAKRVAAAEAQKQRAPVFAEKLVRNRLKDPSSAIVRSVMVQTDSYGHLVVCGGVNARNSYGGYTGEKGFVATPETGSVEIESPTESDNVQFNIAWTNNCR